MSRRFLIPVFLFLILFKPVLAEDKIEYTLEEQNFLVYIFGHSESEWDKIIKQNLKVVSKSLLDKLERNIVLNLNNKRESAAWQMAFLADMLAKRLRMPRNYRLGLAMYYRQKGEYGKSLDICQHIIITDPENERVNLVKGMVLEEAGSFQAAFAEYMEALRRDPKNEEVYLSLGRFYQKLGEKKKARESFKKAVELNPNSTARLELDKLDKFNQPTAPPAGNLQQIVEFGERLLEDNEFQAAEEKFKEVLKLEANHPGGISGLASLYLRTERSSEAVSLLEGVIEKGVKEGKIYRLYGNALEQRAEETGLESFLDQAITAYENALKLSPNDTLSQFYLQRARQSKAKKF